MAANRISDFVTTLALGIAQAGHAFARWLNLAEAEQLLPRKYCHYTTLNLRGVPRKHAESAIRLQLNQLGMFDKMGFSYLISGEQANVWYWNDELAQSIFPTGKVLPYPEPLWRTPITITTDIRFIRCSEGYELESVNEQGVYRSRWFIQPPNEDEMRAFYRDAGLPFSNIQPSARPAARLGSPLRSWKTSSNLGGQLSPKMVLTSIGILLAGCIFIIELAQIGRINQETRTLEAEAVTLKKQTASIAALESSIKKLQPTAQLLADQMKTPQQASLLASLISNNVIGQNTDVYLTEWSYRSNNITATLLLGPKAKGANVLSTLEKIGAFKEIRLLPDPPANSLRVELKLGNQRNTPWQDASTPM